MSWFDKAPRIPSDAERGGGRIRYQTAEDLANNRDLSEITELPLVIGKYRRAFLALIDKDDNIEMRTQRLEEAEKSIRSILEEHELGLKDEEGSEMSDFVVAYVKKYGR